MAETRLIRKDALARLFEKMIASGRRILAPKAKGEESLFEEVQSLAEVCLDHVQTRSSAKDAVFPKCEAMLRYTLGDKGVVAYDEKPFDPPATVVFGARPCDARSIAALTAIFNWDYPDKFYLERLAGMTIIGLACTKADSDCFCTSVGGSPGDTTGSDILLTPVSDGEYLAEVLTEKGRQIVALAPELFTAASGQQKETQLAKVAVAFDVEELAKKLPALFNDDKAWVEQSLRCLGCGACAFVCPTCACFDIEDEPGRCGGDAAAVLGFVRVFAVHDAHERAQPSQRPEPAVAAADHAQILVLPGSPGDAGLRGLRAVLAGLPGGHEPDGAFEGTG